MKIFVKKLALFSILYVFWMLTICLVDPYNLVGFQLIDRQVKRKIAYQLNYPLWKYIEFKHQPVTKIVIGDSRTDAIKSQMIHDLAGQTFYNFSFGGGTAPETIDTFWFAAANSDLKEVVIGMNFDRYIGNEKKNRCIESARVIDNKLLYFLNPSVAESVFYILRDRLTGGQTVVGKPARDRADFWRHQLSTAVQQTFTKYRHPDEFYLELKNISQYCEANEICLKFLIMPIHMDLQNKILEFGLENELIRFKEDLKSLGTVYDFHRKSRLTIDANLYSDPMHCRKLVQQEVVRFVFADPGTVQDAAVEISYK